MKALKKVTTNYVASDASINHTASTTTSSSHVIIIMKVIARVLLVVLAGLGLIIYRRHRSLKNTLSASLIAGMIRLLLEGLQAFQQLRVLYKGAIMKRDPDHRIAMLLPRWPAISNADHQEGVKITQDLSLSYRARLGGWNCEYDSMGGSPSTT
ncbi:hypothetical protein EDD21DRAFT_427965 [Dissophora ornata]|nr:hypothetical protein EDD21DRAFT_427965 [Dissophora ornata]